MSKEKLCAVCNQIIRNSNLDKDLRNELDNFIKTGCKIDEFLSFCNNKKEIYNQDIVVLNKYLLEKHQTGCLRLDLKTLREQKKFDKELNKQKDDDVNIKEKSTFQKDINMLGKLEQYHNMSFQEREVEYLKLLREINYMTLISVHHQLLHGKYSGAIVPKEDIAALKNTQDILQVIMEDTFDNEELPQIDINVINTQITNNDILQQYDFPLSQDPSIEYKKLNENLTDNIDIETSNDEDLNDIIEKVKEEVKEDKEIEENIHQKHERVPGF